MKSTSDPFVGRQIGRITLERRIGYGGAGSVYQGVHAEIGKRFAVKVLRADLVTDEETKARFQREARVLAEIEHPNVVSIIDFGHLSGLGPYMVMEWLEGATLFEERKRRGFLSLEEIVGLFDQFLDALDFMHKRGIIHRDLKPENIMLVQRGQSRTANPDSLLGRHLKIFDFGIALFEEGDERRLTAAGMVVGTPHYMAPEQIIVDAPVDHRADLYAAGAILFELLTGRPPFWGVKRPVEVMDRHLRHPPPPLSEAAPHLRFSSSLQAVVSQALAKHPNDRFQSGRDFFDALKASWQAPPPAADFVDESTLIGESPESWEPTAMVSNPLHQGGGGDYLDHSLSMSSSPDMSPLQNGDYSPNFADTWAQPSIPPKPSSPEPVVSRDQTTVDFHRPSGMKKSAPASPTTPASQAAPSSSPRSPQASALPPPPKSNRMAFALLGLGLGFLAILLIFLLVTLLNN